MRAAAYPAAHGSRASCVHARRRQAAVAAQAGENSCDLSCPCRLASSPAQQLNASPTSGPICMRLRTWSPLPCSHCARPQRRAPAAHWQWACEGRAGSHGYEPQRRPGRAAAVRRSGLRLRLVCFSAAAHLPCQLGTAVCLHRLLLHLAKPVASEWRPAVPDLSCLACCASTSRGLLAICDCPDGDLPSG